MIFSVRNCDTPRYEAHLPAFQAFNLRELLQYIRQGSPASKKDRQQRMHWMGFFPFA